MDNFTIRLAQVVSKSIQFDEFGNPEEIGSKNLKNLISYNTSVDTVYYFKFKLYEKSVPKLL
ncbi:hypothetical protein C2G38_2191896 [Gigaspora rosea]|uniref:Uncharacterized protein n=1 Tax=Gigaspora rosea TaxID=44941 RepID=A0A397V195_9GLOM|nr:hypothetical protein C2G38_2191896 [Gigaspora rosea]